MAILKTGSDRHPGAIKGFNARGYIYRLLFAYCNDFALSDDYYSVPDRILIWAGVNRATNESQ